MKNFYLFGLSFLLLIAVNSLQAQTEPDPLNASTKTAYNEGFLKGTSQIALQELSLGFGYGRFIGGAEIRYGYFLADNNLLYINAGYHNWGGAGFHSYNLGLNYRRYFTDYFIKPFAQAGFNRTWNSDFPWQASQRITTAVNDFQLGAGAAIQVKRFGFEAGAELIFKDASARLAPLVGFTFKF